MYADRKNVTYAFAMYNVGYNEHWQWDHVGSFLYILEEGDAKALHIKQTVMKKQYCGDIQWKELIIAIKTWPFFKTDMKYDVCTHVAQ